MSSLPKSSFYFDTTNTGFRPSECFNSPFPHRWWAVKTSRSDRTHASPAPPSGCEAYSVLAQRGPASGPSRCACTGRGPGESLQLTARGHSTCSCTGSARCWAGTPADRWKGPHVTSDFQNKIYLIHSWKNSIQTSTSSFVTVHIKHDKEMRQIMTTLAFKTWLSGSHNFTCMPHTLTPSVAEVLCSHFFICLAAFSSDASSPCCLVPIFRSRMQG